MSGRMALDKGTQGPRPAPAGCMNYFVDNEASIAHQTFPNPAYEERFHTNKATIYYKGSNLHTKFKKGHHIQRNG